MIKIIPKEKRFFSDMGDMNSYFLFSFADYYDPLNNSFGNLRVFNDDFLKSNSGFDFHPHKHYEILTLMLEGTITHKDSLGNVEKISKNEIQFTNTSTGIMHSEINEENVDLKLYQIWFSPNFTAPNPRYFKDKYSENDLKNNLYLLASGIDKNPKHKIDSEISIYRGIFDENTNLKIDFNRYVFIYVTSGELEINGKIIGEKDQVRAFGEEKIEIKFNKKSDIVVIYSN